MAKVLILNSSNHNFDRSAPIIHDFLSRQEGVETTLSDDKTILESSELASFDVCVNGIGFTRRVRQPDGKVNQTNELTDGQAQGLFSFVRSGKGLVGIHGAGWWIGGEAVNLLGGHANWHPPGLEFTVNVEDADHPVMRGLDDFTVDDEIYMSAWDPSIHILASAKWAERSHPMAWTHTYGEGRVFFTTLGHGPGTFEHPSVQKMIANATRWAARES
jgi:uncharacterized protein